MYKVVLFYLKKDIVKQELKYHTHTHTSVKDIYVVMSIQNHVSKFLINNK
jgi:hypothetical protein